MFTAMRADIRTTIDGIRADGLYKDERVIAGPQGALIRVNDGAEVLNFCANNYLGLADHPDVVASAARGLREWGFGLSSVRFICGTQSIHKQLEMVVSDFLGTDDTILFGSCFDANGGIFETLLGERDAVISDELNHASIIDGVRLAKARRLRYRNRDLADLETQLQAAADARYRMIVTDGVFSMDGFLAPLDGICALADRYDALVMVDDSHASGFVGPTGRGTPELFGVQDRVDIVTSTLGKALGGASGGFASGRAEIVELLRQRARPYLFSNSVPPPVVAAAITAIGMVASSEALREQLRTNTALFRSGMTAAGFDVLPGEHPIAPVMIGDAGTAAAMADALLHKGIYVVGFSYPVVPKGKARIRVQLSAAHSTDDVRRAVTAFTEARDELADQHAEDSGKN